MPLSLLSDVSVTPIHIRSQAVRNLVAAMSQNCAPKQCVMWLVPGSGMLGETETGQVVQQLVKEPGAAMDLNRWGAILQVSFSRKLER